jgi:hypothetical protein
MSRKAVVDCLIKKSLKHPLQHKKSRLIVMKRLYYFIYFLALWLFQQLKELIQLW